jgi:hypothetical protein
MEGTVRITLVNQSELVSDAEVETIARACNSQLQNEVGAAWEIRNPLTVASGADPSAYQFSFVDEVPEAPGALAYHYVDEKTGMPAGKIGVKVTQNAGVSLSSTTSHETVELQCDIFCASWSYSDRLECLVATEACDPVQSQSYHIDVEGTPVEMSNFVTPYYFTDDALGHPLDHLRLLNQTFEIGHGGYQMQVKAGAVQNVFAEGFNPELRRAKEAGRGRTFWRHVTMALVMKDDH